MHYISIYLSIVIAMLQYYLINIIDIYIIYIYIYIWVYVNGYMYMYMCIHLYIIYLLVINYISNTNYKL